MAVEPELLCLDEPFSALDVLSAESLRGELMELWISGKIPTRAVLMVTHNIEEATFMADRVVVMDTHPGRVVADFKVPLPHPRVRKDPKFLEVVDKVYGILAGQTQPEHVEMGVAPGESGRIRALPHITVSALSGLLEHLAESTRKRFDIYQLADDLHLDSDSMLKLIDLAELLGFATVAQGDISLTPLGETFAEAGILARKQIFATRIRRLPMFQWLLKMLRASERQELKWDVVLAALELDFPPEEAEKQLETVVNWGRYAELLVYDDDSATFSLESEAHPTPAG
jgi:NitT/TauT family transport system ATP-binding protein